MRTINENYAFRLVSTPGSHAANAHYGEWIDMLGFRRCLFVAVAGELDADLDVAVYEATSSDGDDAAAITGLSDDFANGTDESRVGLVEVRDSDLSDGFRYVTLQVTPGAADGYACIAVLGEPYEAPVSNATTDGVAFNVGE